MENVLFNGDDCVLLGKSAWWREIVSDFGFVQNEALLLHTSQKGLDLYTHSREVTA